MNEWVNLRKSSHTVSAVDAYKTLIYKKSDKDIVQGRTSPMIVPKLYEFKVVDELVTNFHAPDSTLMLLVSYFLVEKRSKRSTNKLKS